MQEILNKLKDLETRIERLEGVEKEVQAKVNARKKIFYDQLCPYVETYGSQMVRKFYDYWTELNRSGTKMRFEIEKTWETSKRMATWARNSKVREVGKMDYYKAPAVDDPVKPGEVAEALKNVKIRDME
jgi:hypothetical protein